MQTETWQPELVHDTVGTGDAEEVTWSLKDEGASPRQRLRMRGRERSELYVPGLGPRPPDFYVSDSLLQDLPHGQSG